MARTGRIATVLFIFLVLILCIEHIQCYPRKRATGGVPHFVHDLFVEGQRIQRSDTSGVMGLLDTQLTNFTAALEKRDQQLINILNTMLTSFTTLTKGLHLTAGDCSDVAAQGPYASGTYMITPWDDLGYKGAFKVYCDMDTDEGGWTVFQRRFNGSVDFFRGWEDYKNGFGNLEGEFWLGLTKLNRLTSTGLSWQLRVDLEDFDGNTAYALYDNIRIGDESTSFQLTVGEYSGTAGDSLTYHANMLFSTKDRDNDQWSRDCAGTRAGSWWYNVCEHSNLNGPYFESATNTIAAITWYHWKSSHVALKKSQMKIRPVQ